MSSSHLHHYHPLTPACAAIARKRGAFLSRISALPLRRAPKSSKLRELGSEELTEAGTPRVLNEAWLFTLPNNSPNWESISTPAGPPSSMRKAVVRAPFARSLIPDLKSCIGLASNCVG